MDERVARLKRLDGGNGLSPLHLGDVEIGHADVADLTLLLEFCHRGPALLNILLGDRPMDLVQVDGVDPESPQAGLTLAPDRVGFETVTDLSAFVPNHAAFGENVWPLADPFKRSRDDLLRMAQPVDGCGVDPIDSGLESLAEGRD